MGAVSFDLLNMLSFHSSILFGLINAILFATHLTSALPEQSRVTLCEFTINGLVNVLSNSPSLEEQATFLLPICDQLTDEASLKNVDGRWTPIGTISHPHSMLLTLVGQLEIFVTLSCQQRMNVSGVNRGSVWWRNL